MSLPPRGRASREIFEDPFALDDWDLEQSSQTVRLSRDEVDAALGQGEDDPAHEMPDVEIISYQGMAEDTPGLQESDESWAPPGDLEQIIARFNAKHRVVYRADEESPDVYELFSSRLGKMPLEAATPKTFIRR